ncbi:MAG: glycosyltransferase family 4 protein [Patescibacteria group bacterium]
MKIALIGQKGIPTKQGGIEKHVEELSTRLARAGFDVTVYSRAYYTGNYKNSYTYQGVKIINLPSIKTKNLDAITHTLFASIDSLFKDYDIIHYHGVGPSLLSWIPRLFKPKAKVIATFHCIDRYHQKWGGFARFMLGLGEWAACRFPHQTITVSETLKKYCKYRFDRETSYIPNGVQLIENKNSNDILKKYNLEKNGYLIAVSRLIQHKGIHTLIKAYQQLKTEKKLVLVGTGANTDNYVNYLKNLSANNDKIIFTGQKSGGDLETLFKNSYLFIQPSEAEGLSIALLEAMAYNIPVLISDIEENREAVKGFALEFKNKDIEDLARKLNFACDNPKIIKDKAQLAKTRVDKEYGWDNIVKQTISLYQEIMPEKRRLALKKA